MIWLWLAVIVGLTLIILVSVVGSFVLARVAVLKDNEADRCATVIGHDRCELLCEHEGPHLARGN